MNYELPQRRSAAQKPATVKKKPYYPPVVQVYGTVHVLTQSSGSGTNDSSTMKRRSDQNAKDNIVRIGTHPLGVGLYLFDYKPQFAAQWGQGRQFGVMAQEVETMMPSAVSMDGDGYKAVDYAALGIHQVKHQA